MRSPPHVTALGTRLGSRAHYTGSAGGESSAPAETFRIQLEDGSGAIKLEDDSGYIAQEDGAPLDGLSAETRAAIAFASWDGGRLFSDWDGPWVIGRRSDDPGAAALADLRGIADALALRDGDAVSILAHRLIDQSGHGFDFDSTELAYQGVLVRSDGTPNVAGDGTLAKVLPDNTDPGGAYSRAGRMGLAADTSAYELWFDAIGNAADSFACWGFWDGDAGYYAGFFDWYPDANFARFDAWPAPTRVAYVEWYAGVDDGYFRGIKPAGASTSDIRAEVNGVELGDSLVDVEGVPSLAADADRTSYMLFAESLGPTAAAIAIGPVAGSPGGAVPAEDVAILRAFFRSIATP